MKIYIICTHKDGKIPDVKLIIEAFEYMQNPKVIFSDAFQRHDSIAIRLERKMEESKNKNVALISKCASKYAS